MQNGIFAETARCRLTDAGSAECGDFYIKNCVFFVILFQMIDTFRDLR